MQGFYLDSKRLTVNPENIAKLIADVHSININDNEKVKYLTRFDKSYIKRDIFKIALITKINPIIIKEFLNIVDNFSKSSDLVFYHVDFYLGNIITNEEGNLTLIDFEDVIIGYRQYDIADMALNLLNDYGEAFCLCFLNTSMEINGCCFDEFFTRYERFYFYKK